MPDVELLYGTGASGRAGAIDARFLAAAGGALLVVPARASARARITQLARSPGCPGFWGQPVCEFNDFAAAIVRGAGQEPVLVSSLERRLLLAECLRASGSPLPGGDAATPGLVRHLLHVITELKQAAVEPGDFRARVDTGDTARGFDALVAEAYAAYQDALKRANAFDVPGLYWQAEHVCQQGPPRYLAGVSLLCFDGFDDFTPSQLRLIEAAAAHVDRLCIGINYNADPDRADLYALPHAAAEHFTRRYEATVQSFETDAATRDTQFAARHIFWRSKAPRRPDGLEADVTVTACTDATHEAEVFARRVKGLLRAGVRSDDIAVVYRDLGDAAPMVRAVFEEAGVPVRVATRPTLAGSALGAFFLRLLDALGAWEREAVVEVLTSPWFGAVKAGARGRETFPTLARAAGVIAGADEWTTRVDALARRLKARDNAWELGVAGRIPYGDERAAALLDAVDWLQSGARALPEEGTLASMTRAFAGLADAMDLARALERGFTGAQRDHETAALEALHGLFQTLAATAPDAPVTRSGFFEQFRDGLHETTCRVAQAPGGVGVYDAESMRTLRFAHVFFGGLNEGTVPRPPRLNALYSEADLAALRRAGIALEGRREHALRERLLFQHVLETPAASLTLSWRMLDENGRERMPSPFLADVALLLGRERVAEAVPLAGAFVPRPEAAVSRRELRNAALYHAPALCASLDGLCADAEAGAAIEKQRDSAKDFDAHDGVLADPSRVAARFGPEAVFSVSRIEAYLGCPFRFFRDHVLRIGETEAPLPEMSPLVRGSLLHDILQDFHTQYRETAVTDIPDEEAAATMFACVDRAFEKLRGGLDAVSPGAAAVERVRMESELLRYLETEREREDAAAWLPAHFEVAFGRQPPHEDDDLSNPEPFAFDTGRGVVRFSGRIDRIDRQQTDAGRVRLIDYKTGGIPAVRELDAGKAIQLLVYALAVEQFLAEGATCVGALYLRPGKPKGRRDALYGSGRNRREQTRESREDAVRAAVAGAVAGIRDGRFPPTPEKGACRYCGPAKACRYQEARIARKVTADAAAVEEDNGDDG